MQSLNTLHDTNVIKSMHIHNLFIHITGEDGYTNTYSFTHTINWLIDKRDSIQSRPPHVILGFTSRVVRLAFLTRRRMALRLPGCVEPARSGPMYMRRCGGEPLSSSNGSAAFELRHRPRLQFRFKTRYLKPKRRPFVHILLTEAEHRVNKTHTAHIERLCAYLNNDIRFLYFFFCMNR